MLTQFFCAGFRVKGKVKNTKKIMFKNFSVKNTNKNCVQKVVVFVM